MSHEKKYPDICKHALFMISLFGSTYLWEQVFFYMKYTKLTERSQLSDSHLENSLRVPMTTFELDIMKLVRSMSSIALMFELEINHDFSNCFYNGLMPT